MTRNLRSLAVVLALAMTSSGCFGSFNLTRTVWKWNKEVTQEKWGQEAIFLVIGVLLPGYGIATLADAVIINSIEFWTGENPIEFNMAETDGTRRELGRHTEGDVTETLAMEMRDGAPVLTFARMEQGETVYQVHVVRRDGVTRLEDVSGNTLMSAHVLPDGGFLVRDAHGEQVAVLYNGEAEAMLKAVRSGSMSIKDLAARFSTPRTTVVAQAVR